MITQRISSWVFPLPVPRVKARGAVACLAVLGDIVSMRVLRTALHCGLLMVASSGWAQEDFSGESFILDPSTSLLAVLVRYDRSALISGHDHGVQATQFEGSVRWVADDVTQCAVQIRVPLQQLTVDPPRLRPRLNLKGETSPRTQQKIAENMWGAKVLDVARFPMATFQSTACEATPKGILVSGGLAVHGVSASVQLLMDIRVEGARFHAKGELVVDHSIFKMVPYRALMGAVRNDAALTFYVDVSGTRVESTP